jgi:hypothetical protein
MSYSLLKGFGLLAAGPSIGGGCRTEGDKYGRMGGRGVTFAISSARQTSFRRVAYARGDVPSHV